MAITAKQKKNRIPRNPRKRTTKVADMTTDELRTMLESLIDIKMSEWIGDPDAGLELRPEIIESIERQRKEYAAGKRGKSLDEVARRLELG
ncbi:MAG: hypothetical protein HZB51_03305 [Chloroflexi bacterium]|nr:hypothetical protein [Chloroflexota bacterium]